ncbi:hypothetical protein P3G55_05130 [Leptospira sp. 96542]|nr:hypothetical protein [Leptospira sp. 96542]
MKLFLTMALLPFLIQCSQMIWREASLPEEVSPGSDPKHNLVLSVSYEEKDPWNPLNGTTDKRAYKTKIKLVETQGKLTKEIKEWDLPSWALSDGAFYHSQSSTLFVLYGKDDEYGTLNQTLSIFPTNGGAFSYPASPENRIIFQMAPSPNGKLVALITANQKEYGEYAEFELNLIQLPTKEINTFPISFWTALPMYGMRWSEDGSSLYLRTPDRVLKWSGGDVNETKTFPDCFSIPTNFGRWAYESAEVVDPGQIRLGKKLPSPKLISDIEKIRLCR